MTHGPEKPLTRFVRESNSIEGIWRDPLPSEIDAHETLLAAKRMSAPVLERFVGVIAPGNRLRDRQGLDVRVGDYYPPRGGAHIRAQLHQLLAVTPVTGQVWERRNPLEVHRAYESLHPFTDGNGRSGRVLWAWHMQRVGRDPFALPFLHRFYYQSLDACRA